MDAQLVHPSRAALDVPRWEAAQIVQFLYQHDGILVSVDGGEYVCCVCAKRANTANLIDHSHNCPFWRVQALFTGVTKYPSETPEEKLANALEFLRQVNFTFPSAKQTDQHLLLCEIRNYLIGNGIKPWDQY